ncbi:Long-chain-alcohol oxidase FAO2 [Acorus calamus]|uniref:Long-chain-alcohol oxidase n=1 Tax=Acorus calamus TaxID=4465 RepID=A0AAV9C2U9_ACOCL|nr:Long-chain-alcohol oxidase FAO2 [Acorus calamus]
MGEKGREGHPLLTEWGRGGKGGYQHGLSKSQIESMASLCETLIPSLPFEDLHTKSLRDFYMASGSDHPIPDETGDIDTVWDGELVLGLPFHQQILRHTLGEERVGPQEVVKAEVSYTTQALLSPSQGFLLLHLLLPEMECHADGGIQMRLDPNGIGFHRVKLVPNLNENQENPSWDAIGYQRETKTVEKSQPKTEGERRPLHKGIIDITEQTESITLLNSLQQKGLKVTKHPTQNDLYDVECDVVVVGSGCGGGVAAAVLSGLGHKVVVVEKGRYFAPEDLTSLEAPSMDQMYDMGGFLSSVDGKMMILAGTTVGGGSAVNWSACFRTPDSVMKEWAQEYKLELFRNSDYYSAMDTRFVLENNDAGDRRKQRCLGVIASTNNKNNVKRLRINAKATISACGALLTPPLMVSSGLRNPNIGKNLHLHPVGLVWGYFPDDSRLDIKGKCFEGGILTSVHKVMDECSETPRAIIETPQIGPASYASLIPWVSGAEMKEHMVKYARTSKLFALVKDKGCGTIEGEGRIQYYLDKSDKENLRDGMRRALRILVAAGAVEVGTFRSDGQRIKCGGVKREELEGQI